MEKHGLLSWKRESGKRQGLKICECVLIKFLAII